MDIQVRVARHLAASLLAGVWNEDSLRACLQNTLGQRARVAQNRLLGDILRGVTTAYPPAPQTLVHLLLASPAFKQAARPLLKARRWTPVLAPAKFTPSPPFAGLDIPQIAAPGELATWLGLSLGQLDWLADAKRQHRVAGTAALQNYHYMFMAKRSGAPRLIEQPKPRLMAIQRRILREILDPAPVHARAHGFVRKRSCRSAAVAHAGEYMVVTADLKHFFTSINEARIHGLFRSLGYPHAVARLLTGLCTTATPLAALEQAKEKSLDWQARKLLHTPHLPQGAPTSPALANLTAWSLDKRLAALAERFGAHYTRYADDMAFSGDRDFARAVRPFLAGVAEVVANTGFALNPKKTRLMRASGKQRVTGIVVNAHTNIDRDWFDRLKATLHNCATLGPAEQNRESHPDFRAHLDGKVGWVETVNPARGQKLRQIFERIAW